MNPYFNDSDFQVRQGRYDRMLQSAQTNIELQKGEDGLPVRPALFLKAAALVLRLSQMVHRSAPTAVSPAPFPALPCPDESPC